MTHADPGARLPLRVPTATATFAIGIAGYLGVNLSPYMITAAQAGLGLDVLAASWLVTSTLLLTAVTGLAIAPLCAGVHRRTVARAGLVLGLVAFGAAALVPAMILPGLLLGGVGVGGAVAASGAALAAFRNPDRVAGFNGLANRGVITIVLAVVPVIGLAPFQVFGALALFSLIGLVLTVWLPAAPVAAAHSGSGVAEAMPIEVPSTGAVKTGPVPSRVVTLAGFALLLVFVLWAVSEDSLWAMAGVMGAEQANLTPAGLGIALSAATAGGLLGSIGLMIVGDRLGRAAPLIVLLVAGGALKILHGYVADPNLFIVVFVAWNTIYALAFMYFVSTAAALDADGRWSGPLLAVYLIGSALTPVIGAAITGRFGFEAFAILLGVASVVLAVPTGLIARLSSRLEGEAAKPAKEIAA